MQRNKDSFFEFSRRFISETELEQITGISRRTWQKHRLLNRGPCFYKICGAVRYELDEVLKWIKGSAVPVEKRHDR